MQFKLLALFAVAGFAVAQSIDDLSPEAQNELLANVPEELIAQFAEDPAGTITQISEEVNSGSPPEWFTGLSPEVQEELGQLVPGGGEGEATGTAAPTGEATGTAAPTGEATATGDVEASASEVVSSAIASISEAASSIAETATGEMTGTGTEAEETAMETGDSTATGTEAAETTGAAAVPTGFVNAGFAGVIGVIGALAL